MPRRARLAVLCSALLHGALILAGRYRFSYDAYNHMFFGDHYRMNWWSLWEPRWYTGFSVTSYPPLVHQLIGALSHVIGLDAAFGLLLWAAVTVLPLAVYAFARIFTGRATAGYAALGTAGLPSVYLTAHIFGQLPTLAATVTALFAVAALNRYLRLGDRLSAALCVSLFATVMAFHHATLLLLPWLVLALTAQLLFTGQVQWKILGRRLLPVGLLAALGMLAVIWPFWDWGRAQSIQTPIDHASRHNFFTDPVALLLFFLPVYGPLAVIIPGALALARRRRLLGPGGAFLMLFLLGLGDTTPLPRLLFGKGWEWLTYDRFAFWASLMLLPFLGMIVILLRRERSKIASTKIFLTLAIFSLIVGLVTVFLPLQPGAVDLRQVVDFLRQGNRSDWRYLTFGFGDQLARLSTLTTATTLDGSYHTARTLPELRTSGIGQIDTAFWLPSGLASLDPILVRAGGHGVRWGFVNIPQYIPVLERHGWKKIETLRGGVQVWENPQAVRPSLSHPPPEAPLASFSWGTLPLLSLIVSLLLGSLRLWPLRAEKALRAWYAFVVAFIPLSLCFWYFRTIQPSPHRRIYFTYTDALFFLSDAVTLLAVLIWLARNVQTRPSLSTFLRLPSALVVLIFLSSLWSRDRLTSLYISLHILLVFLFSLSLSAEPRAWRAILPGLCAALCLQAVTGIVGFMQQSTAFLSPLELKWPGILDPSARGAVVVQLPDGESFLRAYGTLPHPNILGGFGLVLLLGPLGLFLRSEHPNKAAWLLLVPGVSLLALSFSRAAWLGLVVLCMLLIWKSAAFERKRLAMALAIVAASFVLTLLPFRALVQARTVSATSHAEQFSFIGRAWLNGEAIRIFLAHPLTGVGIGSFILELSRRAGEGYVIEPAHNILLLAAAELGIPGLALVVGSVAACGCRLFKTRNPQAVLAGATLAGLAVIGLLDHYLWTLAPGRLMLGLVAGLYIGQDAGHEA